MYDYSELISNLLFNAFITLIIYMIFPLCFASLRKKAITRMKYRFICYAVNGMIHIFVFALLFKSFSFVPCILWTWLFCKAGESFLKQNGFLRIGNKDTDDSTPETAFSSNRIEQSSELVKQDLEAKQGNHGISKSIKQESLPQSIPVEQQDHTESVPIPAFCRKCGFKLLPDSAFCSKCGTPVFIPKPKCKNCGEELPDGAAYCHHCGNKVSQLDFTFAVPERVGEMSAQVENCSDGDSSAETGKVPVEIDTTGVVAKCTTNYTFCCQALPITFFLDIFPAESFNNNERLIGKMIDGTIHACKEQFGIELPRSYTRLKKYFVASSDKKTFGFIIEMPDAAEECDCNYVGLIIKDGEKVYYTSELYKSAQTYGLCRFDENGNHYSLVGRTNSLDEFKCAVLQ